MQVVAIIIASVLAAITYGIIHDQVTARICVEYFTIGHPRLIDSDSPTVLGLFWGVVATWWVGLPLGIGLAVAARAGLRPKLTWSQLVRPLGVLLCSMFTVAILAGLIGYFTSSAGVFLTAGWAHSASYLSGILGGIVLWIVTWRRRGKEQTEGERHGSAAGYPPQTHDVLLRKSMKTNRDLYKAIEALLEDKKGGSTPTLEVYLGNLRNGTRSFSNSSAVTLDQFFSLLRNAFDTVEPDAQISPQKPNEEFDVLISSMAEQIQDLVDMAANGQLKDDQKYFGITAPSGRRWYNFDPCAYIECGAAGALGGWEDGDGTGRSYVPGKVAHLNADGEISTSDPRELDRQPEMVPEITWEMFSDFVWCGQDYE